MSTIAFEKIGSVYVLAIGKQNPSDPDWARWVAFVTENSHPNMKPRILVCTDGGAPSAAQRASLNEVTQKYRKESKVCVLTDSTVARGAVTALSWFFPELYRAHAPSEIDKALDFLELPPQTATQAKVQLRVLLKKVEAQPRF
jgi:hypothetical protein